MLVTVGNAGMGIAGGMNPQEVVVLGEDDSPFGDDIGQLVLIDGATKVHLRSRRDIDAATPETFGDGRCTVLIQVEAHRPGHTVDALSRRWTVDPP